ncbi:uncharacterized protein STEHIDRAFT_165196 [Stereum hirsutum FP-91666 SS1]|uniref:uncharacterized protein n=1 Tax=Stereum hirsutum (strain FP-91666) TaxID=721885 RepID=UPI000440F6CA|nr:uncharacterized protein STEHIDRAFT_165196 [Stereum hirsutum FP-91666 SS1]EIM90639.1 hypothetical protein STEHIDRAFT_165196 [Stereum hirsutum FP-91666 SS1]
MSDEYASSGFKGSLANESAGDYVPRPTDSGMNNTSAGGGEGTGRDYTSSNHGGGGGGQNDDYKTGNYPPEGDSTSSGGYGSTINSFASKPSSNAPTSTFTPNSSNSNTNTNTNSDSNLITQSTNGTSLTNELDDAKQGVDGRSRDTYAHEQGTGSLNPYGGSSMEGREEAGERLGGAYAGKGDGGY